MSEIVQDKESIEKLNNLLLNHTVGYFLECALNDEDWLQYTSYFPMYIDNKCYSTLKDYIANTISRRFEFGGEGLSRGEKLVKDLIAKTSYISNFGGVLRLDIEDLHLIEEIRLFSEGKYD